MSICPLKFAEPPSHTPSPPLILTLSHPLSHPLTPLNPPLSHPFSLPSLTPSPPRKNDQARVCPLRCAELPDAKPKGSTVSQQIPTLSLSVSSHPPSQNTPSVSSHPPSQCTFSQQTDTYPLNTLKIRRYTPLQCSPYSTPDYSLCRFNRLNRVFQSCLSCRYLAFIVPIVPPPPPQVYMSPQTPSAGGGQCIANSSLTRYKRSQLPWPNSNHLQTIQSRSTIPLPRRR